MKKIYLAGMILLLLPGILKAQISHGGIPLSFSVPLNKKLSVYELPEWDYRKMFEEDVKAGKDKPFRYGKVHGVQLTPENSGDWQILDNGDRIWTLMIRSQKAYSLSIICNLYELNPGAAFFIYSSDHKQIIGSFTFENNIVTRYFSTVPLPGSEIILELDVNSGVEYGKLGVSGVVHDYKNVLGFGTSGACNVNINCPDGANWQDDKRSVVKYIAGGNICTGALINNTAQDGKPYLLTANHCVSTADAAAGGVFWFNYESPECVALVNPSHQSLSSSSLIATGGSLDFTLLELSTTPPENFHVYYAGWNRGTTPATNTVCIHHPDGDIKKITFDNDPPVIGNYGGGYITNSHWNIIAWDKGTTEAGSSGAPLFDQNHRIIGNLTGGYADCSYNFDDYFNRFDMSWSYFSQTNKQLKVWLDPLNTGTTTLDGLDLNVLTDGLDAKIKSITDPGNSFCGVGPISPKLVIYNNGTENLTSLTLNYQINDGSIITENWTGNITPGGSLTYTFSQTSLPFGNNDFKAFISKPNGGIDLKSSNDTLSIKYFSFNNISSVNIDGGDFVCQNSLVSVYSTKDVGTYLWDVIGGQINAGQNTDKVTVTWDKWGTRSIGLNISNLCNAVDAQPIDIRIVEHGIKLSIQTGINAESVCMNIIDCDGNIIFEKCGLPSDSLYTENLVLDQGCYNISINAGTPPIKSLSVDDYCGQSTLLTATDIIGNFSKTFNVGESGNKLEFNIYPNPTIEQFVIEAYYNELYKEAKFSVSNLMGKTVVPYQNLSGRLVVNVNKLPQGVYIVKIKTARGDFSKKIIKK